MPAYTTDTGDNTGRRQVAATVVLVFLSVALAYLPSAQQQQIASALRATVLRPFVVAQAGLTEARSRASGSEALRRQADSLAAILAGHRTLAEENRRLRGLLELRTDLAGSWMPASVVRPRTTGSESMFLLDVGSDSGVQPWSPVLTRQGLVGVVREVRGGSAIGIDWTHPDFRASAMDAGGLTYGIVETRRGEFREEDRLVFNGTAFHTRLEDGTVVVTSGLGGVFPRGIPVGKVEGLAEADAGWRKSYWLRPMVDPGSVTHVLVGAGGGAEGDFSSVWPPDSVLTEAELAVRAQQREDSLRSLGDSVALLRAILSAPRPVRDSVLVALAGGDSLPLRSDSAAAAGGTAASGGARDAPAQGASPQVPAPARPQPRPAAGGGETPRFPRPTDTLRVGGGRDTSAVRDTTRRDTLRRDTIRRDTIRRDTIRRDTLGGATDRPGTGVDGEGWGGRRSRGPEGGAPAR